MSTVFPPEPLVSTAWLAEHLADPALRIVDIRGHVIAASEPPPHYFNHQADYERSHLPGAIFIDWVKAITDPADPRHARIAPPERYAALMESLGIGDGHTVVAYDDADGMFAARLWWSLRYYGHRAVVLDGGWKAWTAEGRPTDAQIPHYPPAVFTAQPDPSWIRSAEQVAARPNQAALIDVRTPAEFTGQASRAQHAGHIPGALNLPRGVLVSPDHKMPTPEVLRAQFEGIGTSPNDSDSDSNDVVFYCNGGVSASYGLLAYHAAGFTGGSVYDGSWKDWGNSDRPISTK